MTNENQLVPIEDVNALELFTGGGIDQLLEMIKDEVSTHVPDLETVKGREEIKSLAYKISRSKTTIDGAGKELVAGWKARAKEVDAERRKAREYLDNLRDTIRAPLTEWEAEEERKKEARILAREIEIAHSEALEMNALIDREAELRRKEAELQRKIEEQEAAQRAEREAKERAEREERIRREAEEKAQREAALAIAREQERANRAEQEKKAAIEAERKRAERVAQEKEDRRLAQAERERQEAKRRAEDKANRERINEAIIAAMVSHGSSKTSAQAFIKATNAGNIPHVHIVY